MTLIVVHWRTYERPEDWSLPAEGVGSIDLRWPWLARAVVRVMRWAMYSRTGRS